MSYPARSAMKATNQNVLVLTPGEDVLIRRREAQHGALLLDQRVDEGGHGSLALQISTQRGWSEVLVRYVEMVFGYSSRVGNGEI